MSVPIQPQPPFPVLASFVQGTRLLGRHARFFAILSFFPFAVTLATLVGMRLGSGMMSLFWLPVAQLPSSFVIGLQCALILRFIILHEYPVIDDETARRARNRVVTQAAVIYAAVSYFVAGAYAALIKLRAFLIANPDEAAPYAPLAIALMALMLWAVRWFWLHVPVALDWPVDAFFRRVGKWAGSLRIFALFALCSLLMNLFAGFFRSLLAAFGGAGGKASGFIAAADDAVVALATLLLALLFTCASAVAVKIMAGTPLKDIEA